ncbi:TspO/MBR family protein [Clostridium manihotivorum]|uniref:Tryptophan-rich sensory protein n=1 Tax=Clostridium manihotivorum TaxID=2320868 RepID=A0A410DXY0_9CLOT|nr:TspO/MBR family protein [Clostridium manihotivorum]QAA33925.1 tryptophan-rich sensory protein [Clostridium manihotivorum]
MNIFKVNGKFNIGDLIISILIALGGGMVIGIITASSDKQYLNLSKPILSPPSWIFPIVWIILYLLMAIAAYRVYQLEKQGININNALLFYSIQLVLNFLWPLIFFKLRLYGLAFIELVVLFIFIIITFIKFLKVDRVSGILIAPYILWVTYAGVLNFFIWMMNEM